MRIHHHLTPVRRAARQAKRAKHLRLLQEALDALSDAERAYYDQLLPPGRTYGLVEMEAAITRVKARMEVEKARAGKPHESLDDIRQQLFGRREGK